MKTLYDAALLCLTAVFIGGCSSRHAGPVYRAGDENPPDFLVGPVAAVLTNLNGFSAHVTSTVSSPEGTPQVKSGELLGREGRLIYQPMPSRKDKKARKQGGLFFIWDESKRSGYVMSEALQGYAPIKSDAAAATRLNISNEGIREDVNGHPCHRCKAVVVLNDGREARLTLWQADDEKHFPIRIEAVNGPSRTTLDFSEIRLETPARELFLPPDGFTAYGSSTAMMNELIVREASAIKKNQAGEFDEPTDVRSSNWHQTPGAP